MRTSVILFAMYLSLATPGLAVAETNETRQVPVPALRQIWLQHLDQGIAESDQPAETREWFCRTRMALEPDVLPAIETLALHWNDTGERTLAAAAMSFARALGSTNLDERIVAELTNHVTSIVRAERDDPFVQTRVEMMNEEILKTHSYLNLEEYQNFETKLRAFIRQSNDRKEALEALIQLYELQREPILPTLLARLALQYDPTSQLMIERCLQGLQTLGKTELVTDFLRSYANTPGLAPELNQMMSRLCTVRGYHDEALMFLNRWAMQQPGNASVWQLRGENLFKKRKYEPAMQALLKASKLPHHAPEVYLQIALVAERTSDISTMALWLERWRESKGDDALLEALQAPPFNRHPGLLKEFR